MKEHSVYSKGGSLTGSTPETWQEEFICFDVITEFGPQCSAVTEVTAGRKSDLCILSSPKVDKWASLSSQEIKTPQNTENQPSSVDLQTLGSRVGQFQTSIHPPTHPCGNVVTIQSVVPRCSSSIHPLSIPSSSCTQGHGGRMEPIAG